MDNSVNRAPFALPPPPQLTAFPPPRVAVVTGANRGLGFTVAMALAHMGFCVYLACRDLARAAIARQQILEHHPRALVGIVHVDLLDLSSIPAAAKQLARVAPHGIDVLVNNAGVAPSAANTPPSTPQHATALRVPPPRHATATAQLARTSVSTNYFGTYAVCREFGPLLKPSSRVINVSCSMGQLNMSFAPCLQKRFSCMAMNVDGLDRLVDEYMSCVANGTVEYHGWPANPYAVSKAAENAMTRVLSRDPMFAARGITVNAMVPPSGASSGVDTILWLALDPSVQSLTGMSFSERQIIPF